MASKRFEYLVASELYFLLLFPIVGCKLNFKLAKLAFFSTCEQSQGFCSTI
uniref:Uncharacterized protein n=1 Tax=Anguilla anguilla TaxID=7936 RepID=A0A0E9SM26_ANGAN